MWLLIGADEAGYGPNLGPLVVAVSVWRGSEAAARPDLYELLGTAVTNDPRASPTADERPLAIGDSKQLYDSTTGLGLLEHGVLSAWGASTAVATQPLDSATTWRDFWGWLDPESQAELSTSLWYRDHAQRLPLAAEPAALGASSQRFRTACAEASVELVGMRARGIFPQMFNGQVEKWGNKAELLSHVTLGLIRDTIAAETLPANVDVQVWVSCDKHGGRNRYAGILQHFFPDPLVEVRRETRAVSTYRWRDGRRRVEVEFRRGGESALPVALASMTAKYLRELSMGAFNAYWQRMVPGIRPTAGYPTDARRFKQDIAVQQRALGIADELLWRNR